ncbi:hypothetical protein BH09PAT1_BH09PAT1_4060 [soil metagenome]
MGTGSPGRFAEKRLLIELYEKVPAVRSLELNYTNINVASGKMDALVDAYGMSWDLAPFKVIIEEAGGKITRLDGSEWRIDDQKGAIVSNGLLHEEVLSITKKYY